VFKVMRVRWATIVLSFVVSVFAAVSSLKIGQIILEDHADNFDR
jgi:hypothetical protein